MVQDTFTIKYPPVSAGTEKTDILFYESEDLPQLLSFLVPNDGRGRILVTDSTIIPSP